MSQIKVKQSREDAKSQPIPVEIKPPAVKLEDILFCLDELDDDTHARVLKSSKHRRKGIKVLRGATNG